MRFESIKIRNLGAFKSADVDLSKIDGQLIAITGANGAGKSTLLETLAGALFRQCPTRGSLGDLATARDSSVEVRAFNGRSFTIRQTVDAISKKGETLVLDEHGSPLVASGKMRDGDDWVARNIISPDVLYASAFSPQASGGFVALKPSERKAVLLRVLQIERLERLAELARKRAAASKAEADTLRARIADEEHRTPDLDAARAQLRGAEECVQARTAAAARARDALERAKAASADAQRAAEVRRQRAAVIGRRQAAERELASIEERITNNRKLLEREDEIRGAARGEASLAEQAELAKAKLAALETRFTELAAESRAIDTEVLRADRERRDANERITRAQGVLALRDRVAKALADLPGLRLQLSGLEAAGRAAEATAEAAVALQLNGAASRIVGLRGSLQEIYAGKSAPITIAEVALRFDDAVAESVANAPGMVAAARAELADVRERFAEIQRQVSECEKLAARASEVDAANAEVAACEGKRAAAVAAEAAAKGRGADVELKRRAAESERGQLQIETRRIADERAGLASTVAMLPRLEAARARIEELTAASASFQLQIAAAVSELSGLPEIEDGGDVDLGKLEADVTAAEREERVARDDYGRLAARLEAAEAGCARIAQLRADLSDTEVALADWTRLAQDLGRDGLQAMEIDAAIPELNEIANDLLHTCVGSRFTVQLSTQRLDAKGKRELEGLDVRVLDTEHGRDDLLETYSGGENVIVAEAVALALTTVACRRAGLERPTLVRDESGAALDPVNGRAYVAMLRRAAKMIGADKALYVSHTPELQELADARLHVANGTVEVSQ
jgi:exonuclease SbcC